MFPVFINLYVVFFFFACLEKLLRILKNGLFKVPIKQNCRPVNIPHETFGSILLPKKLITHIKFLKKPIIIKSMNSSFHSRCISKTNLNTNIQF